MKYEITNSSPRGKAFKVFGGTEIVKAGETKTVDIEGELADEQIEAFARDDVKITPSKTNDQKPELDREKVKSEADELGLTYAKNISTEKLAAMVDEALAS